MVNRWKHTTICTCIDKYTHSTTELILIRYLNCLRILFDKDTCFNNRKQLSIINENKLTRYIQWVRGFEASAHIFRNKNVLDL